MEAAPLLLGAGAGAGAGAGGGDVVDVDARFDAVLLDREKTPMSERAAK